MKRLIFVSLLILLGCIKHKCIGENPGYGSSCDVESYIYTTNDGKGIKAIFHKSEHIKLIRILSTDPDSLLYEGEDTIFYYSTEDPPKEIYLTVEEECSKGPMNCRNTLVKPLSPIYTRIYLCDSCKNILGINPEKGSVEVFSDNAALADSLYYVKLYYSGGSFYALSLTSYGKDVLISYDTAYSLAPDTSFYEDSVRIYGYQALWFKDQGYYGKMRIVNYATDSADVEIFIRNDLKGLRWIK